MSANDDGPFGTGPMQAPVRSVGVPPADEYDDGPTRMMPPRVTSRPVPDDATVVLPPGAKPPPQPQALTAPPSKPPSTPPSTLSTAAPEPFAFYDSERTQVLPTPDHPAPPLARPPAAMPPPTKATPTDPPVVASPPAAPSVSASAPTLAPPTPPTSDPTGRFGALSLPNAFSSSGLPGHTLGQTSSPGPDVHVTGEAPIRQVGRYLIQSRLGRGGMATVYKAHDPSIGRSVAIKFLHAALAEDEEYRARFLQESRAAGGLSHPNIVVVHDVGEIEGRPYMAMELIDGEPLADILDKQKRLPIRDAVVIAIQLARALAYAHERGIVHRDIKPGNVMLLRDGKTVKVTDFGIAHMDDGGSQRTQVGAVMGTPQYMSPEQTRGEKLDGRSDLFSAGIVLYQMLAGQRPFGGDNLVSIAAKIANDPPTPLTQLRSEVPASLRRVLDRCLAKPPGMRYPNGTDLAEGLSKVLAELDEAARESAKPRIVPLRVKWALMMALIVAVVMGSTAAVITQRQYAAMMGQAIDYGSSLAHFIARQYAASALGEEWEVVDVAVQDMMKTGGFERIVVIDPKGIVRASSRAALVGKPYQPAGTQTLARFPGGAAAVRYDNDGEPVLGFESPIQFQDKLVGRVALGIPEQPLTQVARLSITLMIVLVLVTVAAVALATYFLVNWFAKPIRLVGDSMAEIGRGHFSHRIDERRNDEFGLLFQAFDAMAQSLQARWGGGEAAGSPPPATDYSQTLVEPRAAVGTASPRAPDRPLTG